MFLVENSLSQEIKALLGSATQLRIAVAFFGDGASQWIGPQAKDVKVICNLTMGGTNPKEIEALIKRFGAENVKQIDNLHAKLYIGDEYAIVGSANMSANGLGVQPHGLREAGYKFELGPLSGAAGVDWFDDSFNNVAQPITKEALGAAAERWGKGDGSQGENGESVDICSYNFNSEDFPLMTWVASAYYDTVDVELMEPLPGGSPSIDEAIDDGIEVEGRADRQHLERTGRWVLIYRRHKTARAPYWAQLSGKFIDNCFRYEGESELRSVAVTNYGWDSGPFKIDKAFKRAFSNLILEERYKDLTSDDYDGCWFDPRIELMQAFWKELQSVLCKG